MRSEWGLWVWFIVGHRAEGGVVDGGRVYWGTANVTDFVTSDDAERTGLRILEMSK